MRVIDYSETEQIANCSLQRGSRVYDVQIVCIEYDKIYDPFTEQNDIELMIFDATFYEQESESFVPLTLTNDEQYQFKRGLLEYIDFESESDMFDGGDRDGSCY